jgi:hypothetical protein
MSAANDIKTGLTKTLANFTKQRKAEEKQSSAFRWRASRMREVRSKNQVEVADRNDGDAWPQFGCHLFDRAQDFRLERRWSALNIYQCGNHGMIASPLCSAWLARPPAPRVSAPLVRAPAARLLRQLPHQREASASGRAPVLRRAAPVGISPGAAPLKIFSPKPPREFFFHREFGSAYPQMARSVACKRDEMMPRKIEEAEPAGACAMTDGRAAKAGTGSV